MFKIRICLNIIIVIEMKRECGIYVMTLPTNQMKECQGSMVLYHRFLRNSLPLCMAQKVGEKGVFVGKKQRK